MSISSKEKRISIKGFIIIMALVLTAAGCNRDRVENTLTIGGQKLEIEIARTEQERSQGLSGRDSMPENFGMLFEFETEAQHEFWMKDMNFPLDFIWIKDGKVSQITSNVMNQPGASQQELVVYRPIESIDGMLEVNAGWAAKNGIKVGDSIIVD